MAIRITVKQLRKLIKEAVGPSSLKVGDAVSAQQVQEMFPQAWTDLNQHHDMTGVDPASAEGMFTIEPLERLGAVYNLADEDPAIEVVPGGALVYYDDALALGWLGPLSGWDSID